MVEQPLAEDVAASEIDRLDRRGVTSFCVVSRSAGTHSVTRSASMPFSASTARIVRTVIAAGRMAFSCGLTITALPVASAANSPG